MREREHALVNAEQKDGMIRVSLTHPLERAFYDLPLTLKTYVPGKWTKVMVTQGTATQQVEVKHDGKGAYVLYQVSPNSSNAELSVL
jgi:hypothetical protein